MPEVLPSLRNSTVGIDKHCVMTGDQMWKCPLACHPVPGLGSAVKHATHGYRAHALRGFAADAKTQNERNGEDGEEERGFNITPELRSMVQRLREKVEAEA